MLRPSSETGFHNQHRDSYISRCENGLRVFSQLYEDMTHFSERYHRVFFSPPLNVARRMYDHCLRIHRELRRRNPDYKDIELMCDELVNMQLRQFRNMYLTADVCLALLNGFESSVFMAIFYLWRQLEKDTKADFTKNEVLCCQHKDHIAFISKMKIPFIDILAIDYPDYAELDDSASSVSEVDTRRGNAVFESVPFTNTHHFERAESVHSDGDSDDDSDDDDDEDAEGYIAIGEANFDAFEKTILDGHCY